MALHENEVNLPAVSGENELLPVTTSEELTSNEIVHNWRRFGRHALLVCTTVIAAGASVLGSDTLIGSAGLAKAAPITSRDIERCQDPSSSGQLHVSGNQVLDSQNQPFVPYGISVYGGLQDGDRTANWKPTIGSSIAQIEAAKDWHSNTIRIQAAQSDLFNDKTPGKPINEEFAGELCKQVQLAREEGMEVVVNDQTEFPDWRDANPTPETEEFWKYMGEEFGNEPGIIFDLFNEPHLFYPTPDNSRNGPGPNQNPHTAWVWRTWQRGGNAKGIHFVGMQTLVNEIEGMKLNNLIWVEGPLFDNSLEYVEDYPIHGRNIVYDIHHPPLDTTQDWDSTFGYLSAKYPVVDGEWSQYASSRPECRPGAYSVVPEYFNYLRAHNIGLIAWSLQPGSMVSDPSGITPTNISYPFDTKNPKELLTPNTMNSSYSCSNQYIGQGAGSLIMNYFNEFSHPAALDKK